MAEGHELFGETLSVIAVYTLTHKDFIYTTANPDKPIAQVHLTWCRETNPMWPSTYVYESLDSWKAEMIMDHLEFKTGT